MSPLHYSLLRCRISRLCSISCRLYTKPSRLLLLKPERKLSCFSWIDKIQIQYCPSLRSCQQLRSLFGRHRDSVRFFNCQAGYGIITAQARGDVTTVSQHYIESHKPHQLYNLIRNSNGHKAWSFQFWKLYSITRHMVFVYSTNGICLWGRLEWYREQWCAVDRIPTDAEHQNQPNTIQPCIIIWDEIFCIFHACSSCCFSRLSSSQTIAHIWGIFEYISAHTNT